MKKKILKEVKNTFHQLYKTTPLLIFSPGRINLIGEHTDYNDGFVFPAAVNKGIFMAIQKSDSDSCKAFAIDKNKMYAFNLTSLERIPKGGWRNYIIGVAAEVQKLGITLGNFNIAFSGNIPTGAGMSSSAALENSLVFALNKLFKLNLSRSEMILVSQKAEHNFAGVKCGIMDQYASMFGEKKSALLLDCRTVTSTSYKIDFNNYKLLLINTNVKHDLSESAYNDRREVCEKVSEMLGVKALRDAKITDLEKLKNQVSEEDFKKALYVIEENLRVQQFSRAIEKNDVNMVGKLLYQSHNGLSNMFKVSCKELDFLVEQTVNNSAVLGARMMGGGFGGCTINLIEKSAIKEFKKDISKRYQKEFDKSCSIYEVKLAKGTRIINNV
ncbi:galactokinase [Polaribacter tangerinus]|uniref:galactokinase n=1 Tax=Polaribacter tangerinus TaxID=1920034 RepID=UPI000B4A70D9|nr:galactokinase [Polaribacter tangerinus]